VGRVGVIVIAVFMSLQELGVATDIVTTAFAILFGAVALALALSFGLGNRVPGGRGDAPVVGALQGRRRGWPRGAAKRRRRWRRPVVGR
jgi:hypothetical protein